MTCFINHTNHPLRFWSKKQREAAEAYGPIKDLPFPNVSPTATCEEVQALVAENLELILAMNPKTVLCQGEFVYVYHMVEALKARDIPVLAACSERQVREYTDKTGTHKEAIYTFVQFREY